MVQLWNLPPKVSAGTAIGEGLGAGLSQGIQKGSEIGFQRGMLQKALSELDKLPSNASPIEKTKYILNATAGLPDQGRILQAIAPLLIGQGRVENVFGGNQQPQNQNIPNQPAPPQGLSTTINNAMQEPPKTLGGFLPRIKTPQEIEEFARNYARQYNDPAKYAEGKLIAESENKTANAANEMIRARALSEVPELQKHPERIPIFMQEAQKYSSLQDPNEIIQKARQSFKGVERELDVLQNGYVPGAFKGALKKFIPITAAFTAGGQTREEAIRGLSGTYRNLAKKGFEEDARNILAQQHGLSPTEIEEIAHPLTPQNLSSLKSFPDANKIPSKLHEQRLQNFLRENINKDTSLLALRHRLWNEKGYNWQEIAQAMRAITEGENPIKLDPRQETEMLTVENDPPIQSLPDIFRGWGRPLEYLSGAK